MDMERAVELIGTASDDPIMVAFLKDAGVRKMPSWHSAAAGVTTLDEGAVQLSFSAEVPRGKEASEPGTIFLEEVTFTNPLTEKDFGPLTQAIPLGLRIDMDRDMVKQMLGKPDYEGEFLGKLFLTYDAVKADVSLKIRLDKTGKTIEFIRFLPRQQD